MVSEWTLGQTIHQALETQLDAINPDDIDIGGVFQRQSLQTSPRLHPELARVCFIYFICS